MACAPELFLASGGDSHMKRIMWEIVDKLRRGNFPSLRVLYNGRRPTWASGGVTMARYLDEQHRRLRQCSADIVIITIGGNDCDQEPRVDMQTLKEHIRRVVTELEQTGKMVFICQSPRRWTTRTDVTVELHRTLGNHIDRFLQRNMRDNYIRLPPGGLHHHIDNFAEEDFQNGHGVEVVHLKKEHYHSYAIHILEHILVQINN